MYTVDLYESMVDDMVAERAAKEDSRIAEKLVELGWTPPAKPDPTYAAGSVWRHDRGHLLLLVQFLDRGGYRSFLVSPDSGRIWQGALWTEQPDLTLNEVRRLSFGAIGYAGPCLSEVQPAGCDC